VTVGWVGMGSGGLCVTARPRIQRAAGQAGGRAGAPGVRWRAGKGGWMNHGERVVVVGESHCESGFSSVVWKC
jgi:hypothetical protein